MATSSNSESLNDSSEEALREKRLTLFRLFKDPLSLWSSLRWKPTSNRELFIAERQLLEVLKMPFETSLTDCGESRGGKQNFINTIEMPGNASESSQENNRYPLVLIHGFAAGIGLWIMNLDELSSKSDRKVVAFDLIGFGRSSRNPFDLSGDIEAQFVDGIEKWRQACKLEKFIILGHSFGGYLSGCYALKYPDRIAHLILADPWGIMKKPAEPTSSLPFWVRAVATLLRPFNPLTIIRATGPIGPILVHRFRADLKEKFKPILGEKSYQILDYIYHCNAQDPTGEAAFKALSLPFGWAKFPLIDRLADLDKSIRMTFIYGSRSLFESTPGIQLRDLLGPERVTVNVIQGSGHHVFADRPEEFNRLVLEACSGVMH